MKRFGLLAVTGLVFFYCAGYLYGLGYFGNITNNVGWLIMPKDEYLEMGFFAMSDHLILTTFFLLLIGILLISYGKEMSSLLYKGALSNKKKAEKMVLQLITVAGIVYLLLVLITHSAQRALYNGGKALAKDLSDSRVDEVCLINGECLEGKVMRDAGHSYVVYLGSLEERRLEIIPHAKISGVVLGWSKGSRNRILNYTKIAQ